MGRRNGTAALVLASGLFAACVHAGAHQLPVGMSQQAFLHRLDRARTLALEGESRPSPRLMEAATDTLGLPVAVALPGRTVIVAKDSYLDGLGGTTSMEFRRAVVHLDVLKSTALAAFFATRPDQHAIRSSLDAAYASVPPNRPGLFTRVRDALVRVLASAARNLVQFSGWKSIFEWAVVLALAILLFRLLTRGRLVPDRTVMAPDRDPGRSPQPADWRKLAEDALARGDIEGAVRALYRALLTALAARGVVSDDPALTAGECRLAVSSTRPALYPAVAAATGSFERVVYGELPGRLDDVEALRRAENAARAT